MLLLGAKLEMRFGLYVIKPASKMMIVEYATRKLYLGSSRKAASRA